MDSSNQDNHKVPNKVYLKKIHLFIKKHIWQFTTFILGTIIVILLSKFADQILPSNSSIVKEVPDTIKVIHSYNLPNVSNEDSINNLLRNKINQLSQLNLYEDELDEYANRITKKEEASLINVPNQIIIDANKRSIAKKGYTEGNAIAYFKSDCPVINNDIKYIDFKLDFFSSEMIKDIYCLRLSIK